MEDAYSQPALSMRICAGQRVLALLLDMLHQAQGQKRLHTIGGASCGGLLSQPRSLRGPLAAAGVRVHQSLASAVGTLGPGPSHVMLPTKRQLAGFSQAPPEPQLLVLFALSERCLLKASESTKSQRLGNSSASSSRASSNIVSSKTARDLWIKGASKEPCSLAPGRLSKHNSMWPQQGGQPTAQQHHLAKAYELAEQ